MHKCLLLLQVMLAASYWSLLAPAIEMAEQSGLYGTFIFLPVALGFVAGSLFVYLADLILPLLVLTQTKCNLRHTALFQDTLSFFYTPFLLPPFSLPSPNPWRVSIH